jgi:hypothetical protein
MREQPLLEELDRKDNQLIRYNMREQRLLELQVRKDNQMII